MGIFEKSPDGGITDIIDKISTQIQETEDAFIFHTLNNFSEKTYNITVEKEELVQAIQLIRMMKETGMDIHERYVTATQQSEWYRHAYEQGLQDGIEKERNRITSLLEKGE